MPRSPLGLAAEALGKCSRGTCDNPVNLKIWFGRSTIDPSSFADLRIRGISSFSSNAVLKRREWSHHLKSLHFNFSLNTFLSSRPGPADIACQGAAHGKNSFFYPKFVLTAPPLLLQWHRSAQCRGQAKPEIPNHTQLTSQN